MITIITTKFINIALKEHTFFRGMFNTPVKMINCVYEVIWKLLVQHNLRRT